MSSSDTADTVESPTAKPPEVEPAQAHASLRDPLRQPLFRALWIASVVSNIGTWMHETAAAWLMTTLDNSPLMIALVSTASMLPMFLLALPSGAIADMVDRRRLLILAQTWTALCAAALGALTLGHVTGPWLLLLLTLLLNVGNVMTSPAWQAIIPELVGKNELPAAIALGGISFNLSRIVGPALSGLVAAYAGPGVVFLLNALSFFAVVWVLFVWKRAKRETPHSENVWQSMRSGVEYALNEENMRAILLRAFGLIVCGSASWSLFAALAKHELGVEARGFGSFLGCLGVGAVIGGVLMPRIRLRFNNNAVVTAGSLGVVLQLVLLAYLRAWRLVGLVMIVGGFSWTLVMLSLNVAVLHMAPAHLRSRAMSLFLFIFTGAATAGSAFWGAVASHAGLVPALNCAAVGLLIMILALNRFKIAD